MVYNLQPLAADGVLAPGIAGNVDTEADDYSASAAGQDHTDPSITNGALGPSDVYPASLPRSPADGNAPAMQSTDAVKGLLGVPPLIYDISLHRSCIPGEA